MIVLKILIILASLFIVSSALSLKDGETLNSSTSLLKLGFFSLGRPSNRYVGIWYNKDVLPRQYIWVANRQTPITTTTGVLRLTPSGLEISDKTNALIWSTNTSILNATGLQLLDTGNLQVTSSGGSILWQSFDYPTNALLPGLKLGRDLTTGLQRTLSSWKSDTDPSPGDYTYTVYAENHRVPEAYVMKGNTPIWRSGTWDGHGWSGVPAMTTNPLYDYQFINNPREVYYTVALKNESAIALVLLGQNGVNQRVVWLGTGWNSNWKLTAEQCDTYGFCGRYGVCQWNDSQNCVCLNGFEPAIESEWRLRAWTGGCKRKVDLGCGKGDGFVKVGQLKLPDSANARSDSGKLIDECRKWCLGNCSCLAYAMTSVLGGGCINWHGDLVDIRDFPDNGGGDDLYIRLAASELATNTNTSTGKGSSPGAIIAIPIILGVVIISIVIGILLAKLRKGKIMSERSNDLPKDNELPLFAFNVIATSTKNFSYETKIGEGGFGPVHKGTLPNGQQIAVKRLSKGSVQGVDEFTNEIKLIANLQHKNLVRLLGCSIKDDERLLVYEYMANNSLDKYLFDPQKAIYLEWQRRIEVIHGIAQGLLYLHKYSRLRIIHRDLKCSNILLDADMNPKISDFGMARIFGGNQDHANTRRVVGTFGYMPPEYISKGLFSEKSDVFSYGVLLLEVLSGKRNSDFDQVGGLLGRAWELWTTDRASYIMDPVLRQSCPFQELTRCVHVGLLCVQEEPAERPTMSSVVSFLNSDTTTLPSPNIVAFITFKGKEHITSNEVTITAINPR